MNRTLNDLGYGWVPGLLPIVNYSLAFYALDLEEVSLPIMSLNEIHHKFAYVTELACLQVVVTNQPIQIDSHSLCVLESTWPGSSHTQVVYMVC